MSEEYLKMYLEEVLALPEADDETARKLALRLPAEDAREDLINGSLALVARTAMKFAGRPGVDVQDLIQEGNMALMMIVNTYHSGDMAVLRSQAVEEAMLDYCNGLETETAQREEITRKINDIQKITEELARELGRQAKLGEIAARMNLTEEQVAYLMEQAMTAMTQDGPAPDVSDQTGGEPFLFTDDPGDFLDEAEAIDDDNE